MRVEDLAAHKFPKRLPESGNRNTRATMGSQSKKAISSRGSASDQFPGKLHDLMTFIELEGLTDIISWVQNGQAIMVHDPDRLLQLLPIFGLSQTKYRSFERQLNMWHWERITAGPNKGAWMHPCFIRGNKILCSYMSRHCSVPKANVPLHWMCPSKLIPSCEKIESNRLNTMFTRGIRDLANEAFHLDDVMLSKTALDTFINPMKSKSPTDVICKSLSDSLPGNEIVKGDDQDWFEDKNIDCDGGYDVPISVLEPTPLREDFPLISNISLVSHKFASEDTSRNDVQTCHNISLLLEPLADEAIEDFF